ncbi:MAG: hypothetical protein Q7U04_14330, partial [Bacteriovorax sp.]|nr:hypothetical protein [Bacteriovorax sp.]
FSEKTICSWDNEYVEWNFTEKERFNFKLLSTGWSGQDIVRVWSNQFESTISLPIPEDKLVKSISFKGHYYRMLQKSQNLLIKLKHPKAISPKSLGQSDDPRALALYLNSVSIKLK